MEGRLPLFRDNLLVRCAGLVVQNLKIHVQSFSSEPRHYCIVGCDTVYVLLAFEGLVEDEVALFMVRDHDVLVP